MSRLPVFLLMLCCAVCPALAQEEGDDTALDDIPHITMVGVASTEVAADIATITLGVTTERATAREAADENAQRAQAIVDLAKTQGTAAADIATQSVTLSQTFDDLHAPDGQFIGRKPKGFAAENIVAIRVRDLSKAGALAQALIDKGANRFDGISFSVDKPEPILTRLNAAAVANARAQAESAAEAAGVKLGRVLLIERPGQTEPAPMQMRAALKAAAPAAMPVEAGSTTFTREMEVTWAIAPR